MFCHFPNKNHRLDNRKSIYQQTVGGNGVAGQKNYPSFHLARQAPIKLPQLFLQNIQEQCPNCPKHGFQFS